MTASVFARQSYTPDVPKATVLPEHPLAQRMQTILAAASLMTEGKETVEVTCPACGGRLLAKYRAGTFMGRCTTSAKCYAFVC